MALRVACPHCGTTYDLPDALAGKKARCRTCQGVFPVAVPPVEEPVVVAAEPPAAVAPVEEPASESRPGLFDTAQRRQRARHRPDAAERPGRFPVLRALGIVVAALAGAAAAAVVTAEVFGPRAAGVARITPPPRPAPPGDIVKNRPGVPQQPPPPPKRPAFEEAVAEPLLLEKGKVERRVTFIATDPADRDRNTPAKIYTVALEAGRDYLFEMKPRRPTPDLRIRLEDGDGTVLAAAAWKYGAYPALVHCPDRTGTYRLVGASIEPDRDVTVSVRLVEPGDLIPEQALRSWKGPDRDLRVAREGPACFAVAIAPDSSHSWVAAQGNKLERINCVSFKTVATYQLARRFYRVAVDGRNRLYAAAAWVEPRGPRLPQSDYGPADLEIYDLAEAKPDGEPLQPIKTLALGGGLSHLLRSPDGAWLYYLDTIHNRIGRVNLAEQKLDGETRAIAAGTHSLCVAPGGGKLYCCSEATVQVIDPATLAVEKTIRLADSRPSGLQATDAGLVFLSGGDANPTAIYLLDTTRDHGDKPVPLLPWVRVPILTLLALSPDQSALYTASFQSSSGFAAYNLPSRPALTRPQACGWVGIPGRGNKGQLTMSPNGKFFFSDRGEIVTIGD